VDDTDQLAILFDNWDAADAMVDHHARDVLHRDLRRRPEHGSGHHIGCSHAAPLQRILRLVQTAEQPLIWINDLFGAALCSRAGLIWLNARRRDARLSCTVSKPEEL